MTVTLKETGIHKTTTVDGINLSTAGIIQDRISGISVNIIEIGIGIFIAKDIMMDTDPIDRPADIEIVIEKDIVMDRVRIGAMTIMTLSAA